jgi:hypothetical protein
MQLLVLVSDRFAGQNRLLPARLLLTQHSCAAAGAHFRRAAFSPMQPFKLVNRAG